jgi:arylsulfatase A-like enzyme
MWFENGGSDIAFPHRVPDDSAGAVQRLPNFPWMDSLTLDFALTGTRELGLGKRERSDLLVVSLSTTDAVGHAFGPDSRELHDQILRLDRWLGSFLDSLATLVPGNRIVVALTSDHGVTSYPEYAVAVQHRKAGRVWLGDLVRGTAAALSGRYRTDFALDFDTGLLAADVAALRARGVDVDSLAETLARQARQHVGIAKAYTPASLRRAPPEDVDAARWRRVLPSEFGWLVCAVPVPGYVWSSGKQSAEHGTAAPSDVEVPIAFMGPGIRAVTVVRPARTVDIGPTLAAYLGVRPTEPLDGRVLSEVLSGTPRVAGWGAGANSCNARQYRLMPFSYS